MSTIVRSTISKRNPYWIEKHRYYELVHFCLQYSSWKKMRDSIMSYASRPIEDISIASGIISDPTVRCVEEREKYDSKIRMLSDIAFETDPVIGKYILKAVTEGLSYDALNARDTIPCCKDVYYNLYRRFFWLLDRARD